ncbi:MAG TPA: DNA-binding domain-containing protein [Candidatus Acidoferrales bacterium]|nr:DNA-binding domain-containing protein [Candidatus Acidoferrales bacterium]
MKLLSLQRRMARAVMTPLTPSERMRSVAPDGRSMRAVASEIIKPNDRLTSFERLEIYNRQYWFRILSGFAEDFPGLRAVLGGNRFDRMAKAYLTDCPSQSFTLRNLGSRLEGWLQKNPTWTAGRGNLALDMARLEWADIEAFDGGAEPTLKPEDLSAANTAELRLRLQPYVQLLDLRYPVDDLLLEVRKGDDDAEVASNAFSERRHQKRVSAVAKLKPSPIFLAVHRMDDSVYFRRLQRDEFAILTALRDGKPLKSAVEDALRKSSVDSAELAANVQHWFQTWALLGWFCRAECKKSTRTVQSKALRRSSRRS